MNLDVTLHFSSEDRALLTALRRDILSAVHQTKDALMASMSDLQAAVAAEDTVVDSAITLLKGLAAQIAALQPNQAAIDALAADVTAKTAALSDAVVSNTPATPSP